MRPTSVLVVIGTRPEAIKLAPVIFELRRRPDDFTVRIVATAQHREMLDQALAPFGIAPDDDLDLMLHGQTPDTVLSLALAGVGGVIEGCRPDVVLVQGDTTTTLAGALAAFYKHVPVAHVEAGLRSGDPERPFPEEMNRRLTSALARWHFAPTAVAAANLIAEGVPSGAVHVTGNTVVDALEHVVRRSYEWPAGPVASAVAAGRRLVVVTVHRRENWGAGVENVCHAVRDLVDRFDDIHVLISAHPNPVVRCTLDSGLDGAERVDILDPLDYVPFLKLMEAASVLLTDSGGVQEEAPSLGTPVLVLRDVTERPEAVEAGVATLVGTDRRRIVEEASRHLSGQVDPDSTWPEANPFGDGHAAERIVDVLARELLGVAGDGAADS